MKIAFRYANASLFGKLISFWTRSKFQHVEIVFEHPQPLCFSSSEDSNGTRFTNITDLDNKENWEVIDLPMISLGMEVNTFYWVKINLINDPKTGKKITYNWQDIASFIFHNLNPDNPDRWICSAVCTYVLQRCGLFDGIRCVDVSPELCYELVKSWVDSVKSNAENKSVSTTGSS